MTFESLSNTSISSDLTELVEKLGELSTADRLAYYNQLPPELQAILTRALTNETSRGCAESLEVFARYVVTKDEGGAGDTSVKPFPGRQDKPYVWRFLDRCCDTTPPRLLFVEKSRQLMLTWSACLYALWVAKYQDNRLVFIQSKKEEDACNLVYNRDATIARISFMEKNLPDGLRTVDFKRCAYGQMFFPNTGSKIWGIPEGGDQIRSYTPSLVISDEFAFQPEGEDAFRAIRPLIAAGGQFVAISTANSGAYMYELIRQ